jgi:hypothetical protein
LNEIDEVLEYIEFSKQLDGYDGLQEIKDFIELVVAELSSKSREYGLIESGSALMHKNSKLYYRNSSYCCTDIYEMQENYVAIQSQLFDP